MIQNWAKSRVKTDTNEEFLLSGSNVNLTKGSVKFFGNEHKISARLSKSGTGMDNVIFCDFASLERIFEDASSRGFGFISDGDTKNKLSTVLVKISTGSSADAVALRIKKVLPGVHVIVGEKFIRNFSEKLSAIFVFLYSISILLFLVTIISLALVFSITINERRREFSILRVLGANRSLLCSVLFWEAGILGAGGSILGIGLSALIVIPFNALISEKLGLPFAMSGPGWILTFAGVVFVVTVLSCLISAANGAVRVSKIEPYGDVK